MIKHALGAARAASLSLGLLLVAGAAPAWADIVILRDGQVLPSKVADEVRADEYPSDDALRSSGRSNLDLGFDKVKIAGKTVSAALVQDVYCTLASRNANFNNGLNQARSGFWDAAGDSFAQAAEELKDADKQVALWNRLSCARNEGNIARAEAAITDLLTQFPEGYYMPQAQIIKCRVLINKRDVAGAKAALDAITSAKGMNARDYFEAAVNKIDFFELPKGGKAAAATEKMYRDVLSQVGARGASEEAAIPKLRAKVGVGKTLIMQRKGDEARKFFQEVIDDDASAADQSLLAAAYRGLGDVIYLEVNASRVGAKAEDAPRLIAQLDDAALHYLRVQYLYRDQAGDELQPALESLGRVWEWQFDLGGSKDLATATRSVRVFIEAHKMLGSGEHKRNLTRHIKELIARRDELSDKLGQDAEASEESDAAD